MRRDIRVAGENELNIGKLSAALFGVILLFSVFVVEVTKDKSFTSPQNCFQTFRTSLKEKNWKKCIKSLSQQTIDRWTGELVLRGSIVILDVGDDGIIRAIKNPPQDINSSAVIDREQIIASVVQLQIALSNVKFQKLLSKVSIVEKYSRELQISSEELKNLASVVENKPAFLRATLEAMSEFQEFDYYEDVNSWKTEGKTITAELVTLAGDKANISFVEKEGKWKINCTFPETVQKKSNEKIPPIVTEDLYKYTMYKNVPYDKKNALLLDAYIPQRQKSSTPAVILVHGGGWRLGERDQLFRYADTLAKKGYACFSIDYRLAPKYKFPTQLEDCQNALKWIKEHSTEYIINSNKIAVFGYSAGAHLAALMATRGEKADNTDVQLAILGGTPSNFTNVKQDVDQFNYFFGGPRRENDEVYKPSFPRNTY